ncbi:hypothetical protein SSS_02235 [Sarcoptes scabiei]|nr:hypothetical protein SSS_02235 [Sarcoptes scabiei]
MTNVRVGKHNGPVAEKLFGHVVLDHQSQPEYEEQLSKPVRFFWEDGQIKNFEADQNEPEWSINIKKSVLSLFNVNLKPQQAMSERHSIVGSAKINGLHHDYYVQQQQQQTSQQQPSTYSIYEDGINGVCETLYQVVSASDSRFSSNTAKSTEMPHVLNITKTQNYENCLTRTSIENGNRDIRGHPVTCDQDKSTSTGGYYPTSDNEFILGGCGSGKNQANSDRIRSPVDLHHFVRYNISTDESSQQQSLRIDSIYSQGKTVYTTKGQQLVLIAEQNVTLTNVLPQTQTGPIRPSHNVMLHQDFSYRLPVSTETLLDIPYYYLFGRIDQQELVQLIPVLLDSVVADLETIETEPSKNTMEKIVQLANTVSVLETKHLEDAFNRMATAGRSQSATVHEKIVRKLFLDLLGYAGTTDSVLFVKKLYEQDQITTGEVKEILETIPLNLFAIDEKVVDAYLNLLLSDKVQNQRNLASSIGIGLGKLLNKVTVETTPTKTPVNGPVQTNIHGIMASMKKLSPWQQHIQKQTFEPKQIVQVLQVLREALKTSSTFHQKVSLIETIAHTGRPEALAILAPYVSDEVSQQELPGYPVDDEQTVSEERNFLRQITIYALTHLAPMNKAQVISLLLPVFQNKFEPYEIRIAAFTVMLTTGPTRATLERISSEMHQENNRQVRSFVVSALNTVSNFTAPTTSKLAENARYATGFAPRDDLGMQYSKMYGKSFYDHQKQHGFNFLTEWVASNVSQIPRSAYVAVRENEGLTQNVLLELGYNAKGMESLVRRVLEPNGVLSDAFEAFTRTTKDRRLLKRKAGSAQETLQALREKLDLKIRKEDEPKATVFLKLFEKTSYYSFDRHFVQQWIDSAEDTIKDLISQLVQGQDYHYIKLAMPKQMYKVVASQIGLPVVITERHPVILSIKLNQAKLELNDDRSETQSKSTATRPTVLPKGANFTVKITPMLYQTTYHSIFALSPVNNEAVGTQVEKTTRISVPFDTRIGFWYPTQTLSWSFTPKVPQEVYHFHTDAITFITEAKIASTPDRQWLPGSNRIKSQHVPFKYEQQYLTNQFGIGTRLQVTTENTHYNLPWYVSETTRKHGWVAGLMEFWDNHRMIPCTVHLNLETDEQTPVTGFETILSYKKFDLVQNGSENDDGQNTDDDVNGDGGDERHYENLFKNRQSMIWEQKNKFNNKWGQNWLKNIKTSSSWSKNVQREVRDVINTWANQWSNEVPVNTEADVVAHSLTLMVRSQSLEATDYLFDTLLVHTYDRNTYWARIRTDRESRTSYQQEGNHPNAWCFDSILAFPNGPSDFYYEPIGTQELKAVIKATLDFGNDCQTGTHVRFEGLMETGEEKVIVEGRDLESQSNELTNDWFYQQCNVDRTKGEPSSYACERAIVENSYFKQLTLDVEYENVAPEVVNWTRKLDLWTKLALYPYLDVNDVDVQNEPNKIRVVGQYSTRFADVPMVNVFLQTPEQNIVYQKVHTPFYRPVSTLLTTRQVYKNLFTGYQNDAHCTVMEDSVRTFDNVTVQLEQSPCEYLLAKDCYSTERFAAFVRQLDEQSKTKEVTLFVDGKEVTLSPPTTGTRAEVRVDGQVFELVQSQAQVMSNGNMRIYLRQTSSPNTPAIVVIEHGHHDVTVLYDGRNVQVKVGSRYQGKLCGICGDNNQEADNEFTGPDNCVYEQERDFVNSYALTGPHCQQTPIVKGTKVCPSTTTRNGKYSVPIYEPFSRLMDKWSAETRTNNLRQIARQAAQEEAARQQQMNLERIMARQHKIVQQQEQEQEQQKQEQKMEHYRLRTMAVQQTDKICFSVQPVMSCIEGISRPTRVQQQTLGFHCLPSQSISAKKLAEKSQYQVLEIFGKKQVDFMAPFQVPVSCQA